MYWLQTLCSISNCAFLQGSEVSQTVLGGWANYTYTYCKLPVVYVCQKLQKLLDSTQRFFKPHCTFSCFKPNYFSGVKQVTPGPNRKSMANVAAYCIMDATIHRRRHRIKYGYAEWPMLESRRADRGRGSLGGAANTLPSPHAPARESGEAERCKLP